jgi:hypothetical protein
MTPSMRSLTATNAGGIALTSALAGVSIPEGSADSAPGPEISDLSVRRTPRAGVGVNAARGISSSWTMYGHGIHLN